MQPIISVENLGKLYRIQRKEADAPTNFRELLTDLPRRLFKGGTKTKAREFWALRDVSFDIMPGERVGIIGRNGAGKSTLLKLLSRITEPTTGKITLRGRAASLLEVGTGFHPELTGRENIYLNGAILGMSRAEVNKKFDEIVDFSGIEQFLDTPIKRYSSGMYVRLGFAVAAHLEPEILIVDEVLAVGDMAFQKKCLGKMEEISKGQGRTVLFVSHSMAAIRTLCTSCMLLHDGRTVTGGTVAETLATYTGRDIQANKSGFALLSDRKNIYNSGNIIFKNAYLENAAGLRTTKFRVDDDMIIAFDIETENLPQRIDFGASLYRGAERIASIATWMVGDGYIERGNASERKEVLLKKLPLAPGEYTINISASDHIGLTMLDCVEDVFSFTIENADTRMASKRFSSEYGIVVLEGWWKL